MSICKSRAVSAYTPLVKPRAALLLDVPNIKITAMNNGLFVDYRRMLFSLSRRFDVVEKMAFLHPNEKGLMKFLVSIGFEVFPRVYNADSLIGYTASDLVKSGINAIIICSMDGDFTGVEEGASRNNVEVYYVGFEENFSSLLRRKNLIPLESLDCLEKREPKCYSTYASARTDAVGSQLGES